jgi:hypothetical protein
LIARYKEAVNRYRKQMKGKISGQDTDQSNNSNRNEADCKHPSANKSQGQLKLDKSFEGLNEKQVQRG